MNIYIQKILLIIRVFLCPYIIIEINSYNNNNKFNDNLGNNFNNEKSYYFLLDSNESPALAHQIYESFIYIRLLIELNKINNIFN